MFTYHNLLNTQFNSNQLETMDFVMEFFLGLGFFFKLQDISNLKRVTCFPWTSCAWVSYLKDHDKFGALGFGFSFYPSLDLVSYKFIASKTTTPFSSHMSHLFSNKTFFPKCLILYWVIHGKQCSLPIISPPISRKLPMLSLLKASSRAQCLLVIYSDSNFHQDSHTIQSS